MSDKHQQLLAAVIPNRSGDFVFRLTGSDLMLLAEHSAQVVVTRDGNEIARSTPIESEHSNRIDIALGDIEQPSPRLSLAASALDEVSLAVSMLPLDFKTESQQILAQLQCALPPLFHSPHIISIAEGVLRGNAIDRVDFAAALEAWRAWSGKSLVGREAKEQATGFIESLGQFEHDHDSTNADAIVHPVTFHNRQKLYGAAALLANDDVVQFLNNIDTVFDQLYAAGWLFVLNTASRQMLRGDGADIENFLTQLRTFGAICPDGFPSGPFPRPGVPGGGLPPGPTPRPGGWPPIPGFPPPPGGFPFPGRPGGRAPGGFPDPCEAEAISEFRSLLERRRHYRIDSISPANACPGETITISGSGFRFEGHSGAVRFSGIARGSRVEANVPDSAWTDESIQVVVPADAVCGPIELAIPGFDTVLVCDNEIEIFSGPLEPYSFHGGRTQILRFRRSSDDCLHAGDSLRLSWDLCNVNEITLTTQVLSGDHAIGETISLSADTRSYTFTAPTLDNDASILFRLQVSGPCGDDSSEITIGLQGVTGTSIVQSQSRTFVNWHKNVRVAVDELFIRDSSSVPPTIAVPTNVDELVAAIKRAEDDGFRVGVMGSGWSFTDCVASSGDRTALIDTSLLKNVIFDVLGAAVVEEPETVYSPDVTRQFEEVAVPPFVSPRTRLVHVEAGIKIHELNCVLDGQGEKVFPAEFEESEDFASALSSIALSALPSLGGGMGQSIVGAISTGTHGANPLLGAVGDIVRAIHLVGPGGVQWWIEPSDRPITDRTAMEALRYAAVLDPCTRIEYSTSLFNAVLAGAGCAGVIYSIVVEVGPAHALQTNTVVMNWADASESIQRNIVAPPTPIPWWMEVIVLPTRRAWVTTRDPRPISAIPADLPAPTSTDPFSMAGEIMIFLFGPAIVAGGPAVVIGLGTGVVATVLGAVPFYVARRTVEMAGYIATLQFHRLAEVEDELEFIATLIDATNGIVHIITDGGDEERVASVLPQLLNLLWQMGFYVLDGTDIFDQLTEIVVGTTLRPPGETIRKSYSAMTGQGDCASTDYTAPFPPAPPQPRHSALESLVRSHEYAVPADRLVDFANAILSAGDVIRESNDALILGLSIRFTGQSRADLAISQFPRTAVIELIMVEGLRGNVEFERALSIIIHDFDAIPHLGQIHLNEADFGRNFSRLSSWQSALNHIANEGGGLNTFRRGFSRTRNLLNDL